MRKCRPVSSPEGLSVDHVDPFGGHGMRALDPVEVHHMACLIEHATEVSGFS